jgi:hypothetical protein
MALTHRHALAQQIAQLQQQLSIGLTLEQAEALHQTNAHLGARLKEERDRLGAAEATMATLNDEVWPHPQRALPAPAPTLAFAQIAQLKARVASDAEMKRLLDQLDLDSVRNATDGLALAAGVKQELLAWNTQMRDMRLANVRLETKARHVAHFLPGAP